MRRVVSTPRGAPPSRPEMKEAADASGLLAVFPDVRSIFSLVCCVPVMPRSHAIDQFHVGLRYGQRHAGIVHLLDSDAVRRLLHGLLHVDDTRTHGDELNEPRWLPAPNYSTQLRRPSRRQSAEKSQKPIGSMASHPQWQCS